MSRTLNNEPEVKGRAKNAPLVTLFCGSRPSSPLSLHAAPAAAAVGDQAVRGTSPLVRHANIRDRPGEHSALMKPFLFPAAFSPSCLLFAQPVDLLAALHCDDCTRALLQRPSFSTGETRTFSERREQRGNAPKSIDGPRVVRREIKAPHKGAAGSSARYGARRTAHKKRAGKNARRS